MSRQYITTAIDYPNAAPHMGHVLEKVLADVCARWMRLRGDEVLFQTGTDEHGTKIQETADREKMTPKELVDRNVPMFQSLYQRLGISFDRFIRTTDQKVHWPTVNELWKKLEKAGMLEKRTYTGLYCSGCERFLTKRDIVDGKCPIHQRAPEEVKEENWFFLLSKETEWLKKLLRKEYRIVPNFRENETFALLDQGLEDVSFSRPTSSLSWGVPVPGDPTQTMYVWCDALTNYISGIDYFGLNEQAARHAKPRGDGKEAPLRPPEADSAGHTSPLGEVWWDEAEVTHVIGKDIARFHALIWPAMLKHAGVRVPDRLLIHGFLTSEGEKMSKSLGNVVSPEDVLKHFGGNPDPLRFYLSHEVPVGNDGDFSWKRIDEVYDSALRNKLGNLLNRVLVLLKRDGGELSYSGLESPAKHVEELWKTYENAMNAFEVHAALQAVIRAVERLNEDIAKKKPWEKKGKEKLEELTGCAEFLRHIGLTLLPFIPETARRILTQLNVPGSEQVLKKEFAITNEMKAHEGQKDWKRVGEPEILFPHLEK